MFNFISKINAAVNNAAREGLRTAAIGTARAEATGWEVAGDACNLAVRGGVAVAEAALKVAKKAERGEEYCRSRQISALQRAVDAALERQEEEIKEVKEEVNEVASSAKETSKKTPKRVRRVKEVVEA